MKGKTKPRKVSQARVKEMLRELAKRLQEERHPGPRLFNPNRY